MKTPKGKGASKRKALTGKKTKRWHIVYGYCGKHGWGDCECLKIAEKLQPEIDGLFNPEEPR